MQQKVFRKQNQGKETYVVFGREERMVVDSNSSSNIYSKTKQIFIDKNNLGRKLFEKTKEELGVQI